jgi:hypothetical protein
MVTIFSQAAKTILEQEIEFWDKRARGALPHSSVYEERPLCSVYYDERRASCEGCPVEIVTGNSLCSGSPSQMLHLLRSVLPYAEYAE